MYSHGQLSAGIVCSDTDKRGCLLVRKHRKRMSAPLLVNSHGRICTNSSENASRNLLCVALSRQKKLLTVFGDKRMFNCSPAVEFSPELQAMMTICEQEENGKYEHL